MNSHGANGADDDRVAVPFDEFFDFAVDRGDGIIERESAG